MASKSWVVFVKRNFGLLLTGISGVTLLLTILYLKFIYSVMVPQPPARSVDEYRQRMNAPRDLLDTVRDIFSASFLLLILGVTITIIQLVLRRMRRGRR